MGGPYFCGIKKIKEFQIMEVQILKDYKMNIRRGDILYADLSPTIGSEQGGVRPVLILQNNIGNRYSPTVIVCAITGKTE